MGGLLLKVVAVSKTRNGRISTPLKDVESVTFAVVEATVEEEEKFRVGNLRGRYALSTSISAVWPEFTIDIVDAELFGKFEVGDVVDLVKGLT